MSEEEKQQKPEEPAVQKVLSNAADEVEHKQPLHINYLQRKRSSCKTENKIVKSTQEEKLSSKMFGYGRETICFLLALVFTALAALHSSPPRISKPPIAKPFFNESSLVLDYYKGHLGALVEKVTDSDFCFVMYYAPWDAECQGVKEEFEKVAQYYHSQVFFAAINCWHPGSECRARYSKIQSYPVLMMYPAKESGVQYKGIRSASYMIRFIHNFMNPIKRASSEEDLFELLKSHDALMIGYFNFQGLAKSPGYLEFYRAALKSLERDPNGELGFVAITNPDMANEHGVTHYPSASLLMWNETLFYPESNEWTADSLTDWISNSLHRVVTWLQPPGSKSSTLALYLLDGPVLFLFTPRNPFYLDDHNYNLLKEVGLQYYDCSGNPQIDYMMKKLQKDRSNAAHFTFEQKQRCRNIFEEPRSSQRIFKDFKKNQQEWSNSSANCCSDTPTNRCKSCLRDQTAENKVCIAPGTACKNFDLLSNSPFVTYDEFADSDCNNVNTNINTENERSCSTDSCHSVIGTADFDPQSAAAVKKAYMLEECRRFISGYGYQQPIYPKIENLPEIKFTENRCQMNKTLALVAIDSLHYFHFSEGLGINFDDRREKTAVVILNPLDESQYVMKEEYSINSLIQFINNFTYGYLERSLRSNNPQRFIRSMITKDQCKAHGKSICIPELSSRTFLDSVLNPDKDVVVMFHSPYCAFCSAVAYVYLTVAHYLAKMDHLEFVRIDGDNNDLPWEYTMSRYPSILFFPARRKEDSTLYPWQLPVSVGNLLNFVLANLDAESYLEALINVCAATNTYDCVKRTRLFCLDRLEDHLREFRRLRRMKGSDDAVETKRRIVLLKLGLVRKVHLELGAHKNLTKNPHMVKSLRKLFKDFNVKLKNVQNCKQNIMSAAFEREKAAKQRSL